VLVVERLRVGSTCDWSTAEESSAFGANRGGAGFLEGESKRKVSSRPLLEAGRGEGAAEKLDSMSCRCWRTMISAWESECLRFMLGLSR
jgi:hypothetical protein